MQTLKSFLDSIHLEQYHEQFLIAGATDQDLPQLVQFNDLELGEFLSVLDMLPFHSIKFKKSLRELKDFHSNQSQPQESISITKDNVLPSITREFITSHAIIYGKKKNRALTSYEEAINSAALELALNNPLLISKKGGLFDLAKKKLLEDGYQYKRGSSRSKLREDGQIKSSIINVIKEQDEEQGDILLKRQENAQKMSDKRLEKIRILQVQVEKAIKSRQLIENKLAITSQKDKLSRLAMESDLILFEETKIKLTREISKLKSQERKHQWYKRRKLEACARHNSAFSICIPSFPPSPPLYHSSSLPALSSLPASYSPASYSPASYSPASYSPPPLPSSPPPPSSPASSSSSSSSSSSTTSLISCPRDVRESDVRASSISNYDR